MSSCIKLKFDLSILSEIKEYDRMFVYIWEDADDICECKFGERWVFAGQNPVEQCQKRAYESHSVRKDRAKDGKITLIAIFDVTDIAKSVGRYYKKSKMDDFLREYIGYRKDSTGEVHRLPGQDMKGRVAELLTSFGQSLVPAYLSTKQYEVAGEVLDAFDRGDKIILANLCARFGKTIWAGVVAVESNTQLTIVASYVKTVFTSFGNDLKMFNQWADYVHVDTGDDDYQEKITLALEAGKRVIAYLSLCPGSRRQRRINYLFGWDVPTMLVIDEADFGAHKINQADVLLKKVDDDLKVLIMTGTNGERAITYWPIDTMFSVTYPELLMSKAATLAGTNDNNEFSLLENFLIDGHRDLLIPDFQCYQMDLSGPVNAAIAAGEVSDDFSELPSWGKFAANPMKSKGFLTRLLQSLFLGMGGHDELNVDIQTENWHGGRRVALMYISAHNKQMDMIDSISNDAVAGQTVVTLCGGRKYFGKKITQKNCESIVKEIVEIAKKENKSVLIISNIMGQRSFSVPEITEVYLAYDKGENGSTLQKMSRTLTPGGVDKVGKIFSLAFDPNRDDKFDAMLIETAINYKARNNVPSLADALRAVLSTIDIFKCTPKGALPMEKDDYLEAAMARKSVSRVLGKVINIQLCPPDIIRALAEGDSDYIRAARVEATQRGKTRDPVKHQKAITRDIGPAREMAKAREMIVSILENLGLLIEYTGTTRIVDAFKAIQFDTLAKRGIEEDFGVTHDVLEYLFDNDIIKQSHVELMYDA